jgi:hypothetical protein
MTKVTRDFHWAERIAGILLAGLLVGGCASSTIKSREQERYAAYEALDPETRTLVEKGHIKPGLSMDAVYIAWGKPDRVTEGDYGTGPAITWAYEDSYLQQYYSWSYGVSFQSYANLRYVRAQVVFTNGIVKQWQTFSPPGY